MLLLRRHPALDEQTERSPVGARFVTTLAHDGPHFPDETHAVGDIGAGMVGEERLDRRARLSSLQAVDRKRVVA